MPTHVIYARKSTDSEDKQVLWNLDHYEVRTEDDIPVQPERPKPRMINAEEVQAEIVSETQARLDAFAQTRGYDSALSACTYTTSSIPKFASEGQYMVNARDATWAALYTVMEEVLAGTRPMPAGFAVVEQLLPVLVWPI